MALLMERTFSFDDDVLRSLLSRYGMIPTEAEIAQRHDIYDQLKGTVEGLFGHVYSADPTILKNSPDTGDSDGNTTQKDLRLHLARIGPYGMNVWNSTSTLDLLCLGRLAPRKLFKLVRQRLQKSAKKYFQVLQLPDWFDSFLELETQGVRVKLYYCQTSDISDHTFNQELEPEEYKKMYDQGEHMRNAWLTNLNLLREVKFVESLPSVEAYRLAHRFIFFWAHTRGIGSEKFGFFRDSQIAKLIALAYISCNSWNGGSTASDLIHAFLEYTSSTDLCSRTIGLTLYPRIEAAHGIPILTGTFDNTLREFTYSTTPHQLITITHEIERARSMLGKDVAVWKDLPVDQPLSGVSQFLSRFHHYIQIEVQHWGSSRNEGLRLLDWVDVSLLALLTKSYDKIPKVYCRLWPARFESATQANAPGDRYLGCKYLVGLQPHDSGHKNLGVIDQSTVLTIFRELEKPVCAEDSLFALDSSIAVSLVDTLESDLVPISEEHFLKDAEDLEDLSDDDDDDDYDADEPPPENFPKTTSKNHQSHKHLRSPNRHPKRPSTSPAPKSPQPTAKLRPALEVLSRLKWDRAFNSDNFLVGYEDRFEGTREISLKQWSLQSEHIMFYGFIPQHRIVYFKRRSDGVVVWDRERRVDLVFGSGGSKT